MFVRIVERGSVVGRKRCNFTEAELTSYTHFVKRVGSLSNLKLALIVFNITKKYSGFVPGAWKDRLGEDITSVYLDNLRIFKRQNEEIIGISHVQRNLFNKEGLEQFAQEHDLVILGFTETGSFYNPRTHVMVIWSLD